MQTNIRKERNETLLDNGKTTDLDSKSFENEEGTRLNSFNNLAKETSEHQIKFNSYMEIIQYILNSNEVIHVEQMKPLLHQQSQQKLCWIEKEEIHDLLSYICEFFRKFENEETEERYSPEVIRDLLSWASIKRSELEEMYLYINRTVHMLEDLIETKRKPILTIVRPTGSKVSFYDNGLMVDSTPIGFKIHGFFGCESDFRTHDIRNILTADYRIFDNPVKIRDSFYNKFAEDLCNSEYSDFFSMFFNTQLIRTLYANRVVLQQIFRNHGTKMCYGIEDSTYKNHLFFIYNCVRILEKMYQYEQRGEKNFSDLRTFLFEFRHNIVVYFYEIIKMYI